MVSGPVQYVLRHPQLSKKLWTLQKFIKSGIQRPAPSAILISSVSLFSCPKGVLTFRSSSQEQHFFKGTILIAIVFLKVMIRGCRGMQLMFRVLQHRRRYYYVKASISRSPVRMWDLTGPRSSLSSTQRQVLGPHSSSRQNRYIRLTKRAENWPHVDVC